MFSKNQLCQIWNEAEVCASECSGEEGDIKPGGWVRVTVPTCSSPTGVAQEQLLSLAKETG
jgi:hypothetical protein